MSSDRAEGPVGRTLAEKVWDAHVVRRADGEPDLLYIDLHLIHEVTSAQAFDGLRDAGRTVRRPDLTLATEDHNVPTTDIDKPIADPVSRAQLEALRANCAEFGVPLYSLGSVEQGVVHVVGPQLGLTQPGMTVVCGDSHTSTHGAFGALAFGIGTSEVEHVLATQTLPLKPFKTMAINVEGELPAGVTAKDIILAVIARIGTGGGQGYVLEYRGSAIRSLSMEGRMTVCNMSIEAGARAGLDRHVADGHAPFHRQGANRGPAVLEDIALTAAGSDPGDDGQDDVLRGHPCGQLAFHVDRHRLERLQGQRLRRQHMLDLARADAECQCTERPMRRGVGVSADDRHSGLREAKLGADDVYDTLLDAAERVQRHAELGAVRAQRLELGPRDGIGDRLVDVRGRNVVILCRQREIGTAHGTTGVAQAVEGLRARHLMDEVQIDVQQVRLAVGTSNDVRIPDLLRQCASHRTLRSIA